LSAVWQDIVFAARLLRRSPVFTAAVVLTFALGVGVNVAVFSIVNAIVLRPLPVRDGPRMVVVANEDKASRGLHTVSFAELQDFRAGSRGVFEDVAAYSVGFLGLAHEGSRASRVLVTWVTGNYFPLLDVTPALGRLIRSDEGGPGSTDAIVVLGHATWRERFGADPGIVGRTVRVNGRPLTVVGVAPENFRGTFAFSESELYLPVNWAGADGLAEREARSLHALARLRNGVTIERAQAAMTIVAERLQREYPDANEGLGIRVLPEQFARPEEDQYRTNRLGASIMLALVALVMAVATVNVTNLLLARSIARRQELAIRIALGAGRARLMRQLVTESVVLAALGAGAGLLAGSWVAGALSALPLPGDLPVRFDFHLDWRVLTYAIAIALVTGVAVGVLTAAAASRGHQQRPLLASRLGQPGAVRRPISGLLVVGQVACCVVLLFIAGLFVRSLREAERAELGFRPDNVLNVHLDVDQLGYSEARGRSVFADIERSVRTIPGVERVSYAVTAPMGYVRLGSDLESEAGSSRRVTAGRNAVSAEYFDTMGISINSGRAFRETDDTEARPVAIVNERLAELLWPARNPIGQRLRLGDGTNSVLEVIGVTRTGKYESLFEDPLPYFYTSLDQGYSSLRVLHVRAATSPAALIPTVERTIRALQPDLPLYDVQTMRQALGSGPGLFPVRIAAASSAAFGLLAFLLVVVGLYGVVSYLTSRRTQEIGVRIAVGATRLDVLHLIVRGGLTMVGGGLVLGLAASFAAAGVLKAFLFGVSPYDPVVLSVVVPSVAALAVIACAIPAWRATQVDASVALRAE
jgi:predicted permease